MAPEEVGDLPAVEWEDAEMDPQPDTWEPAKKGEVLQGVIAEVELLKTRHGERDIIRIDRGGDLGLIGVWMSARLRLYREQLHPGIEVRLTYLGKSKTDKGNMAHDYKVQLAK